MSNIAPRYLRNKGGSFLMSNNGSKLMSEIGSFLLDGYKVICSIFFHIILFPLFITRKNYLSLKITSLPYSIAEIPKIKKKHLRV